MDIHFQLRGEQFIWNHEKAAANKAKHGISFEQAAEVFLHPLVEFVEAEVDGESRIAAIGPTRWYALLFVVHVEQMDEGIRIISARKATASERRFYEDGA